MSTFGGWKLIVEVCLPIPFVLLTGLLAPAPRMFHRGVLVLVDKTLGLKLAGVLTVLHLMLMITGAAFLGQLKTTYDMGKNKQEWMQTPNMQATQLGKRWRAERNFWISLFCFTLWIVLARVYQLLKAKDLLEDKLTRARQGGPSSTFVDSSEAVTKTTNAKLRKGVKDLSDAPTVPGSHPPPTAPKVL